MFDAAGLKALEVCYNFAHILFCHIDYFGNIFGFKQNIFFSTFDLFLLDQFVPAVKIKIPRKTSTIYL